MFTLAGVVMLFFPESGVEPRPTFLFSLVEPLFGRYTKAALAVGAGVATFMLGRQARAKRLAAQATAAPATDRRE